MRTWPVTSASALVREPAVVWCSILFQVVWLAISIYILARPGPEPLPLGVFFPVLAFIIVSVMSSILVNTLHFLDNQPRLTWTPNPNRNPLANMRFFVYWQCAQVGLAIPVTILEAIYSTRPYSRTLLLGLICPLMSVGLVLATPSICRYRVRKLGRSPYAPSTAFTINTDYEDTWPESGYLSKSRDIPLSHNAKDNSRKGPNDNGHMAKLVC